MPDRYEPKLSVRPPGERRAADVPADGDPLAELARMVSGRPSVEPMTARGGEPDDASSDADIERDLEAELLNDLQASFAALSGPLEEGDPADSQPGEAEDEAPQDAAPAPLPPSPFAAAEPPAPPVRAAAAPEPAAKPEPQKPDAPRPGPARAQPDPFSFDISQAFDEAEAAAAKVVRAEQARRTEPREPRPYSPPLRGPASVAARTAEEAPSSGNGERPDPAPRNPAPPRPSAVAEGRTQNPGASRPEAVPARTERPPVPPVAERPPARRPSPAPQVRGERPNIPLRPLPMDDDEHFDDAPPPPRRAAPVALPPRGEQTASLPSRFAPQRAAAAAPLAPPPLRRPAKAEPPVDLDDEDFEFDLADLQGGGEGPFEDEFTLDDLDMGAYDADEEFPPFPEEEVAGRRGRSGRVVALVAVMLAVVAIGGAAVFLYTGDGGADGPPPIIAAEQGPTKVPPDSSGTSSDGDAQSKLIYDRVDGGSDGSDTRLVTGDAEIGSIPADDGAVSDNPISRVIIPGGPGVDSPVASDGGTMVADNGVPDVPEEGQSEIGPRMVRTVVVKPDGTIVSSEATGVDENGNALPGTTDDSVPTAQDLMPEVPRSEMDNVLDGGDLAVNEDPLSDPPAQEPASSTDEPEPLPGTAQSDLPDLPSPQPEPPAATPAPPPAASQAPAPTPTRQQETQVASRNANGPIDLTPGSAPAAGPATTSGGVLVQVAAQRSEDAAVASYRDLQRRYPSILGAFQPTIVRADLGDRGVYYRVRIGPFASNDATRLCNDLKAAGGDCLLAR